MILWRPVGLTEMGLIFDSGMRQFPARLAHQPIFYPVLTREYAVAIASGWNVRDAPHAGYVLRFQVADDYVAGFEVHVVGTSVDRELWIPAEEVNEFNTRLLGSIALEKAFFGGHFTGEVPTHFALAGKDAVGQVQALAEMLDHAAMDFVSEISANARAVFLNYPFWRAAGETRCQLEQRQLDRCLSAIRDVWGGHPRPAPLLEAAVLA